MAEALQRLLQPIISPLLAELEVQALQLKHLVMLKLEVAEYVVQVPQRLL